MTVLNYTNKVCPQTGYDHLEIEHDGTATWLDLQMVKNEAWGEDAIAFEMYPPQDTVINGQSVEFHYRHLFRWREWPNLRVGF